MHLIKGYFEERLKIGTVRKFRNDKCAIVFIDTDLMNPSKIALDFIKPILQRKHNNLDDYFAYKGNSNKGTAGALKNFLNENQSINLKFYKYGQVGTSFIVENL